MPRKPHVTVSDIHHDIVKAGAIISEVHRDVLDTHAMVRNILNGQEDAGGQDRLVSVTCTLSVTEYKLTTT